MQENVSRLFEICPAVSSGNEIHSVVQRLFPLSENGPVREFGEEASKIITHPDSVSGVRVRTRTGSKDSYKYSDHAVEVKNGEEKKTVHTDEAWFANRPEHLVRNIEGALGVSGLTIVLERGIVERQAAES